MKRNALFFLINRKEIPQAVFHWNGKRKTRKQILMHFSQVSSLQKNIRRFFDKFQ